MINGPDGRAGQVMRYGSVCSGIEAASAAWHPLGWEPQWFSEIDAFPCAVLRKRWPKAPNLGDMTQIHEQSEFKRRPIDLLVGGTPCQSFSGAGLRKGLADPRGHLALVMQDGQRAVSYLSDALAMLDSGAEIRAPRPNLDFLKLPSRFDILQPLAQAFMELETARSLAYWAAWAVSEGDEDAPIAAAAAKARAADAAVATCERAIQAHGGIGFTWEHPLHRFYKRALAISAFMGSGAELRARVAARLVG